LLFHLDEKRDSILQTLLNEYLDICQLQGCVPNSFDNNLYDQAHYLLIFRHLSFINAGTNCFNYWEENLKYFINAFKAGKIMSEFCVEYDHVSRGATGMQYFGTLIDVPIRDPETFEQRKTEYDINLLISLISEAWTR